MTKEELASALDGREYPFRLTDEEVSSAKTSRLVVVFGASDDLMEFRGAITDELPAYEGTTAYLNKKGLLENECEYGDCPHFAKLEAKAATIKAIWSEHGFSWLYETDIPHSTFIIMEEGEHYCRGIVFDLGEVEEKPRIVSPQNQREE